MYLYLLGQWLPPFTVTPKHLILLSHLNILSECTRTCCGNGCHQNPARLAVVAFRVPGQCGKDGGQEHDEHDEDKGADETDVVQLRWVAPPVVVVVERGPLAGGGVHQDQPLDGDDALHQDDAQCDQEQRHRAGQASAHTQQMIGHISTHTHNKWSVTPLHTHITNDRSHLYTHTQQMIGHTSTHTHNKWSVTPLHTQITNDRSHLYTHTTNDWSHLCTHTTNYGHTSAHTQQMIGHTSAHTHNKCLVTPLHTHNKW